MSRLLHWGIGAGVAIALLALAVIDYSWVHSVHPTQWTDRNAFDALYFDAVKFVVGGFVVALLGIYIPLIISNARNDFENFKASRIAYSEAKTGLVYFKLRASTMSLEDASALLQKVHFHKHVAELFDDLKKHLKRRHDETMTPEKWDESIMYPALFKARDVLEKEADRWDRMSRSQRIAALSFAIETKPDPRVHSIERYTPPDDHAARIAVEPRGGGTDQSGLS